MVWSTEYAFDSKLSVKYTEDSERLDLHNTPGCIYWHLNLVAQSKEPTFFLHVVTIPCQYKLQQQACTNPQKLMVFLGSWFVYHLAGVTAIVKFVGVTEGLIRKVPREFGPSIIATTLFL